MTYKSYKEINLAFNFSANALTIIMYAKLNKNRAILAYYLEKQVYRDIKLRYDL